MTDTDTDTATTSAAPPARTSLLNYAFLAIPMSFAGLPLYIHMPDFYTRDFGVSIGLLGTILLLIRLFDAVQDPVIGYIADKTAAYRAGFIFIGMAVLTLGMAGLSYGPQMGINAALWFAVFMIGATTGFSMIAINLNMIGGFWGHDNTQRVRVAAWREGLALTGLLLAAILPPALQQQISAEFSFIILFWVFMALLVVAALLFRLFVRDHLQQVSSNQISANADRGGAPVTFIFLNILKGPHKIFFGLCFLSYLAASLPAVLVLFFIRDYLAAESLSGLFLVLYFISGAACIGIWTKIADMKGPYTSWLIAMAVSILTFIWAYSLNEGDIIAYGIICVLSGIALGADLAMPPALIAERITQDKTQSEATQYYAVLAFLPKFAMALAAGVSFWALDLSGFEAGKDNADTALGILITAYALAPCIIKLIAASLLWHIIRKDHKNHENTSERSTPHGRSGIS